MLGPLTVFLRLGSSTSEFLSRTAPHTFTRATSNHRLKGSPAAGCDALAEKSLRLCTASTQRSCRESAGLVPRRDGNLRAESADLDE